MVRKKSRVAYVVGSIIIGIVAVGAIIAGLFLSGAIDARSVKLVFDSASKQVVYNGEDLVCEEWSLLEGELKDGHEAKVTMTGKQSNVGTSENTYSVVILDRNGADVTKDYDIECNTGVLTVTARPITLLSASATKVYDGTALKSQEYEIVSGDIVGSHILNCTVSGEISTAGKADNVITASVMTALGEDVTSNYAITTVYGTLTVEKRAITLQGASATKIYDGEPLSADSYEIVEGSLPEGQTVNGSVTGTITDAGEIANVVSATVLDAGGNDVTANYDIKRLDGTLKVEKRPLTLQGASATKIYDGTPLSENSYEILEGEMPLNHTLNCVAEGEILNAGTVENVVSATVTDLEGKDVSYNFEITKLNGSLHIEQRPLSLRSASETKEYDGEPLKADSYEVTAGEMPDGHTLLCTVTGERTDVGTTVNALAVSIQNANGEDVSFNFAIDKTDGELTVLPRPITITTGSYAKVYDGIALEGSLEDCYISSEKTVVEGHTWSITLSGSLINAGTAVNKIAGVLIFDSEKDVTGNYDITYDEGDLTIEKRPLTVQGASDSKEYDGNPLTADFYEIIAGELPEDHELLCTVTGEITDAGKVENLVAATIVNGATEDVTHNFLLTLYNGELEITPIPITIKSESEEKVYDGLPLTGVSEKCTVSSVRQLLENHVLKVALTGSITDVGTTTNMIATVTIMDGERDVTKNYELTYDQGFLKVTSRAIQIKTGSDEKIYDGEALTNINSEIIAGELAPNQILNCIPYGTRTVVGTTRNYCTTVIYNENGQDVTNNYTITYEYGELLINSRPITIETPTVSRPYNGEALTAPTYTITSGSIADLQTYDCNVIGTITDAGSVANAFTIIIYDKNGSVVTSNYSITRNTGTLTVTKLPVAIKAESYTKIYDGKELKGSSDDCVIAEGSQILDGHEVFITLSGSITNVGTVWNTFASVIIMNGDKDVTHNYDISTTSGLLEITQRYITIETPTASKEYDGTPLTAPTWNLIYGSTVEGHTLDCTVTGTIVNVGVTDNTLSVAIYDEQNNNVIGNYQITANLGTLEITPIPITIATGSYQRVYDGTPLSGGATDCEIVSIRQLMEGHTWEISIVGSITNVGEIKNEVADVVIMNGTENVTGNYNITYKLGTLKILPRTISIESGDAVKNYDGTPLTCDEYEIVSFNNVVDGQLLEVMITGSRTEVGESENTIADVRITENGSDVTYNYDIVKYPGSLIVKGSPNGLTEEPPDDSKLENMEEPEPFTVARVYSDVSAKAYLRLKSEGDYTGQSWKKPAEYGVLLDDTYSMNYLAGIAIEGSGVQASMMKIELLANVGYLLPYYLDNSEYYYSVQTSDTYNSGVTDFEYSLMYFPFDYQKRGEGSISTSKLGTYAAAERAYSAYVHNTYLTMPQMQITDYLNSLIAEQGWTKNTRDIISLVANYVRNAATYNLKYDSAMDSEEDAVYAFLTKYKEGVCRHYASAATLLYRALGIPARYTVGFAAQTSAGQYVEVSSKQAHAWVEVYLDNIGWINIEVTPGGSGSSSPEEPDGYAISAKSHSMRYTAANDTLNATNEITMNANFAKLLDKGFTYEVTVNGTQKGVGKSAATITSFTLYNAEGKDVTNEYSIAMSTGTLHVYLYEASIISGSASKVYDGTPLTKNEYTDKGIRTDLGHTLKVNVAGSQTDVGAGQNRFTFSITDANGKDVSVEYNVQRQYGTLRVTNREITVKSDDATQAYDRENPTILTCGSWSFVGSTGLADNHKVDVKFTGSQLRIGESDNTFTILILDENNKDVTSNYSITYIYGKLTVTRPTE